VKILITICGRAGSKGVKNKNIREFFGYPLILYTISAADLFKKYHSTDEIDIVVNSDSHKLLEIAKSVGIVNIIERPKELSGDYVPKISVIKHSLFYMENNHGKKYDYVIDLDITSPIRRIEDIDGALSLMIENNKKYDVVFSVTHARRNPFFNMVIVEDGYARKVIDSSFTARQQAPEVFDMNASIYVYKKDALVEKLEISPLDGKSGIYLMEDSYVLDIDNERDFIIMELLYRELFSKCKSFKVLRENITNLLTSSPH